MQENHEKITKELCENNTLVFMPRNTSDAMDIKWALDHLGIPLADCTDFNFEKGRQCMDTGIFVIGGVMYTNLPHDTKLQHHLETSPSLLCTADQLKTGYAAPITAPGWEVENPQALQEFQEWFLGLTKGQEQQGFRSSLLDPLNDVIKMFNQARNREPNLQQQWNNLQRQTKKARQVNETALEAAEESLDSMIGLKEAKTGIRRKVAHALKNEAKKEMGLRVVQSSNHMVLTGPPGTGKTTIAQKIADMLFAAGLIDRPEVITVTRKDVVGNHIGDTAINMGAYIDMAQGAVLFIDEAYDLARDKSGDKRDFGYEAINTLNACMEAQRDNFVCLLAGYPEEMRHLVKANPGLQSRIKTFISCPGYELDELGLIMDLMLEERDLTMTPDVRDYAMLRLKEDKEEKELKGEAFAYARVVRNLVELADEAQSARLREEHKLGKKHGGLDDEAYINALEAITLEDVRQVDLSGITVEEKQKVCGFGTVTKKAPQLAVAR